jgi:hypothetical protein
MNFIILETREGGGGTFQYRASHIKTRSYICEHTESNRPVSVISEKTAYLHSVN